MSKASQFITELKRRRVYSAAVAYIVVGLGVLGGAEVILEPLGLGNARPLIVIVTLIGFPLAMVLAWIYDLTPTGEVPPVAVPLPMLDPEPSVVPGVGAS